MLPALVVDGMNSVPAFADENSDTRQGHVARLTCRLRPRPGASGYFFDPARDSLASFRSGLSFRACCHSVTASDSFPCFW
jgi:hypothetical protein